MRAAALALALAASGCDRSQAPRGQVVATVDGVEITLSEINEEARLRNLQIANDKNVRAALVQELVNRKLLVREALQRKLDKTPEYILGMHRSSDILLVAQLLASAADEPGPTAAEVQKFIRDNPQAFDRRALVTVDRVAIPAPVPPELASRLAAAKSLEQMELLLGASGMASTRTTETWDTASLSSGDAAHLLPPSAGKLFVLAQPDRLVAGKIVASVARPTAPGDRVDLAQKSLVSQRNYAAVQQLLERQKSRAEIRYQRGFEAP